METGFFEYFCSATAGFVFSTRQQDIPETLTGDRHEREVLYLMNAVRRMAVQKSLKLPESFAADCDRDDWIQLAMITMFECCEQYDRKRPFDNFVRFMVSRKLADKQRALLRKNPPVDREILILFYEMKKIRGEDTAIARLAEETGKSVEELRCIVETGVGARVFTSEQTATDDDDYVPTEAVSQGKTPEQEVRDQELQRILFECMKKLSKQAMILFQQHEFEEKSFKKLFAISEYSKSFSGFKRWYKTEIYDPVQQCVLGKVF